MILRAISRVYCTACRPSRTPNVAALYEARLTRRRASKSFREVRQVLSHAQPNPAFEAALRG